MQSIFDSTQDDLTYTDDAFDIDNYQPLSWQLEDLASLVEMSMDIIKMEMTEDGSNPEL